MPIVRFSLYRPLPGRRAEMERLLDSLEDWLSKQEGYLLGFRFAATDASGDIGRIGIWRSLADADHAADQEHTLAIRAELLRLIDDNGTHIERIFEIRGTPHNLPFPLQ
jgi:hypothetical protein